jgi:hypothetical protein
MEGRQTRREEVGQMASAEAVVVGKLESLRWELDQKLRAEQAHQEIEAAARKRDGIVPLAAVGALEPPDPHTQRLLDISELMIQVKLLEQLQATLDRHRTENRAHVVASKDRDEHSSKQHRWLTVTSSLVSFVLGWLLSASGNPAAILHALVR